MVTQSNNPNIDGTIRVVIEYDESQSTQSTGSTPFSSPQNNNPEQGGRFDIAGALQRFSQEQVGYAKESITILSNVAASLGILTQAIGNLNANTIKAMSMEARKDAEFRAINSRRNRESNREQSRRDDVNSPKVLKEQNAAELIAERIVVVQRDSAQKIIASNREQSRRDNLNELKVIKEQNTAGLIAERAAAVQTGSSQKIIESNREQSRKDDLNAPKVLKEQNAAELIAERIAAVQMDSAQKIIASQEKIARENKTADTRRRNMNRSSRNQESRLDERQAEILNKLLEQTKTAAATADKETARAFTAQQYSLTAEQRKEEYQYSYQRRFDNRDTNALSDERRRQYEKEAGRRRDILETLGEEEGGRVLYGEERDKRRQTDKFRKDYDKEHGIDTQFDKNVKQINDTLNSILGVFTFGTAFKNSKVANELLGTISSIMGVLMDVFLTPFLPLLVPMIQALAKLVPMLQGFIQSFTDDPKAAIMNLIKDIFSKDAWSKLLSNLFPDMSAGEIIKIIFGGGSALLVGAGILSAPMILMKLFGSGVGLLGRGIMSLMTTTFGAVTRRSATANVAGAAMGMRGCGGCGMCGGCMGGAGRMGYSGGLGGVGGGRLGGYSGSRFANTMIGPQMPVGRNAPPFIGPPVPVGMGRSTTPFIGPPMPVGRGTGARMGGMMGMGVGAAAGLGMSGGGSNQQQGVIGNATRSMATSSGNVARSVGSIGRMSGILVRILPLMGGLMAALGPLALLAGGIGLGLSMIPKREPYDNNPLNKNNVNVVRTGGGGGTDGGGMKDGAYVGYEPGWSEAGEGRNIAALPSGGYPAWDGAWYDHSNRTSTRWRLGEEDSPSNRGALYDYLGGVTGASARDKPELVSEFGPRPSEFRLNADRQVVDKYGSMVLSGKDTINEEEYFKGGTSRGIIKSLEEAKGGGQDFFDSTNEGPWYNLFASMGASMSSGIPITEYQKYNRASMGGDVFEPRWSERQNQYTYSPHGVGAFADTQKTAQDDVINFFNVLLKKLGETNLVSDSERLGFFANRNKEERNRVLQVLIDNQNKLMDIFGDLSVPFVVAPGT